MSKAETKDFTGAFVFILSLVIGAGIYIYNYGDQINFSNSEWSNYKDLPTKEYLEENSAESRDGKNIQDPWILNAEPGFEKSYYVPTESGSGEFYFLAAPATTSNTAVRATARARIISGEIMSSFPDAEVKITKGKDGTYKAEINSPQMNGTQYSVVMDKDEIGKPIVAVIIEYQ